MPCCVLRPGPGRYGARRRCKTCDGEPMKCLGTIALLAVAALAGASVAQADPVEDFYRGKTLRMLIGYGPGGGYDLYARLVAEFLPRHIPGRPAIVPQNMPGAGSFAAASYMVDAAPK